MNLYISSSDDSEFEYEPRRRRQFRPHINYDLDDFVERFRLSRGLVERVLLRVGPRLQHPTARNCALSLSQQLLLTLRFLATNGFYQLIGDAHGPSKATQCRTIQMVVTSIVTEYFEEIIDWPQTVAEQEKMAVDFFQKGGMPSVVECVDGIHIRIKALSKNEPQYVNRHHFHSINTMMVCGPTLKFLYVSARWPGSVNDARVMRNSSLVVKFEEGWRPIRNAVILAGSAYGLRDWCYFNRNI